MNLVQALVEHRAQALAAGRLREQRDAGNGLRKRASESKSAGIRDFASRLLEAIKKPFVETAEQKLMRQAREQASFNLAALLKGMPKEPAEAVAFMTAPRVRQMKEVVRAPEGAERELVREQVFPPAGFEATKQLLELQQALAPQKVPLKAVLGLTGSVLAGMALERAWTSHVHAQNLSEIMKDPAIPQTHKVKAREAYKILATYAPSIAKDPIFSRDFTRNLIRHEAIDHKIISDLILAEKAFNESRSRAEFLKAVAHSTAGALAGMM